MIFRLLVVCLLVVGVCLAISPARWVDELSEQELWETDIYERTPVGWDGDDMPPMDEEHDETSPVVQDNDIPIGGYSMLELATEGPHAFKDRNIEVLMGEVEDGEEEMDEEEPSESTVNNAMQSLIEEEAKGDDDDDDDDKKKKDKKDGKGEPPAESDKEAEEEKAKAKAAKPKTKQKVFTVHRCKKECKGKFGQKGGETKKCLVCCTEVAQGGESMAKAVHEYVVNCAADLGSEDCKDSKTESRDETKRFKRKVRKCQKLVKWPKMKVTGVRWARKRAISVQFQVSECRQLLKGAVKTLGGGGS